MTFMGSAFNIVPSNSVISGTLNGEENHLYDTVGYFDDAGIVGNTLGWTIRHGICSNQQSRDIYSHHHQAPRLKSDYCMHHVLRDPILPSSGQLHRDSLRQRSSTSITDASSDGGQRTRQCKSARKPRVRYSVTEESPSDTAQQDGKDQSRTRDRTRQNYIERKYRMNLKDKVAELKAAVPSLQSASEGDSDNGGESKSTPKFSKGTILSRATEYIHQLEQVNRVIASQNHDLVQRMRDLEALLQGSGVMYHLR